MVNPMKKTIKRMLAILLMILMVFAALPNVPQPVHAAVTTYRLEVSIGSVYHWTYNNITNEYDHTSTSNSTPVITVKRGSQTLVSNLQGGSNIIAHTFSFPEGIPDDVIIYIKDGVQGANPVTAEVKMNALSYENLSIDARNIEKQEGDVSYWSTATITVRFHSHQWTYTSGSTSEGEGWIQAKCGGYAGHCPCVGTVRIKADPGTKEYDGTKTTASLVFNEDMQEIPTPPKESDITYSPANSPNIGTYTASISWGGKTASTTFKITKIKINPEILLNDWTYGGTPNTPTLKTGSNPGGGAVTYQYKKSGEADSEYKSTVPTQAGNYTVRATIAEAGNYFGGTATKDFKILPKDLIVTIPAENKTYNGNTDASLKITEASFDGLVGTDSVSVSSAKGSFADKNVGTDKAVTITDIVLSGAAASNYKPVANNTTASITPKTVTVKDIFAEEKVYDGNTNAMLVIGDSSLDGKVSGDDLSLSATGAFKDKNVGTDKEVTISGLTLTGTDVGNYVLAASGNQDKTKANITPKEVSLSWSDIALTYNGSEQKPKAEAEGLLTGDECSVTVSGAQKNAGTNYEAEATTLSNSNYKLPANAKTAFSISKAPITITAEDKESIYGDPTVELTYKVSSGSVQGSDTLDIKLESEASSASSVGNYDITADWKTEDSNYEATFEKGTYSIVPREAELTWAPLEFTYNGYEQIPSVEVSNLANGDSCEVTVVGAAKDAGDYEAEATALGNANYKMPTNNKTPFTIKPKEITRDMLSVTPDTMEGEGGAFGPAITMTDNEVPNPNMVLDTDYDALGNLLSNVPGTQFVKIHGKGNYTGVLDTSWVLYKEKAAQDKLPGEGGVGDFEVFVINDPDAPAISFDNFNVELAKTLLSADEMARYLGGENVQVYIQVKNLKDDVPEDDKSKILTLFKAEGGKDIAFFDLTLWKKISVDAAIQIEDTEGKTIEMNVTVPEDAQKPSKGYERTFYAAHVHGGAAKILAETVQTTIAFSSGEFSTYALGLKDTRISNPKYTDIKDEDGNPVTPETPLDEDGDEPKVGDKFKGDDGNEYEIISISEPDPDTDIVTVIVRKIEKGTSTDKSKSSDSKKGKSANTGDENNLLLWSVLLWASAVGVVVAREKKRKV